MSYREEKKYIVQYLNSEGEWEDWIKTNTLERARGFIEEDKEKDYKYHVEYCEENEVDEVFRETYYRIKVKRTDYYEI